ncbi:MAG TPA: hypothetical protein VGE50_02835 [Gammaproteobacteria bacterium]
MKKWMSWFAALLLAGCANGPSGVTVKESDGSSAASRLVMMTSGFIDEAGKGEEPEVSQLNPWIEIDRKSGIAGYAGVTLTRIVSDSEIFMTHAPRWLEAGKSHELRITVGGRSVVLHAMEEGTRWHKNRQDSGFRNTTYFERVRYQASLADMELLAKGPITHISASGKKAGASWPRQERKILPEYQSKFTAFYQQQIAPAL